uniref:Uncharacterized protein n=1 Tax=Plectus sambesii TaxID=2011161 RepID=A0A914UGW5_9BILA
MCKTNQFHVLHLNVTKNRHTLTLSDQRRFIQNVSNWSERKPAFYHGHVAFLDFTRFGQHNPIYINLLREPLERLVSHYYFLRFGDNFRVGLKRSRDGDTETFDDCVARNGKDCDPKQMWLQVPFFCGHSSLCWEAGNAWALEQAKRNLINHYLLVGITENIDQFIELLEATLPRFFKGASAHFASLDESRSHMRNTKKKILPNTTTITVMKESPIYRMESEFYLFAKEQFEFALQRYTASNNENENIALSRVTPGFDTGGIGDILMRDSYLYWFRARFIWETQHSSVRTVFLPRSLLPSASSGLKLFRFHVTVSAIAVLPGGYSRVKLVGFIKFRLP